MYPHKFDVYVATATQNQYGQLERTWTFDKTYSGNVVQPKSDPLNAGTVSMYDPYADLNTPVNLITPGRVFQELLIKNIRDSNNTLLWVEPHYDSTAFEIRSQLPGIDVSGNLVYYVYRIIRSQEQQI